MLIIIILDSVSYRFYLIVSVWHIIKNDGSLEPDKPKKDYRKEKRTSKVRLLTVEEAISHPEKDSSKEKKISKRYAGTVQDADWHPKKEPEDCSREDINESNRIQGEYEN